MTEAIKVLNLYAANNSGSLTPLVIDVNNTSPILDNPSKYNISVRKIVIDLNTIPLLVQDGPDDEQRAVCVIYRPKNGELCYEREPIRWLPHSYDQKTDKYSYDQYSYEGILQAVNEAYKRAFSRLNANPMKFHPPVFTLSTKVSGIQVTLDSCIIDAINNGNTKTFPDLPDSGEALYIGVCNGMNSWFNGFHNFYVGGITDKAYPLDLNNILRFSITPMAVETQTILQSKSSLDSINGTTNVIITSTLPVTGELLPKISVGNESISTESIFNGANIILSEFSIGSRSLDTNLIECMPDRNYRALKYTVPLTNFQIMVYFLNKGNPGGERIVREVYLDGDAFFNLKLKFELISKKAN